MIWYRGFEGYLWNFEDDYYRGFEGVEIFLGWIFKGYKRFGGEGYYLYWVY